MPDTERGRLKSTQVLLGLLRSYLQEYLVITLAAAVTAFGIPHIAKWAFGDNSKADFWLLLVIVLMLTAIGIGTDLWVLRRSRRKSASVVSKYQRILQLVSGGNHPITPAANTVIDALAARIRHNRATAIVALLVSIAVATAFALLRHQPLPTTLLTLLVGAVLVISLSAVALDYRVTHGLYGTNESEAREIIHFILHDTDSSFSGGLGARDLDLTADKQAVLAGIWTEEAPI